jgi:hypothetical protein
MRFKLLNFARKVFLMALKQTPPALENLSSGNRFKNLMT